MPRCHGSRGRCRPPSPFKHAVVVGLAWAVHKVWGPHTLQCLQATLNPRRVPLPLRLLPANATAVELPRNFVPGGAVVAVPLLHVLFVQHKVLGAEGLREEVGRHLLARLWHRIRRCRRRRCRCRCCPTTASAVAATVQKQGSSRTFCARGQGCTAKLVGRPRRHLARPTAVVTHGALGTPRQLLHLSLLLLRVRLFRAGAAASVAAAAPRSRRGQAPTVCADLPCMRAQRTVQGVMRGEVFRGVEVGGLLGALVRQRVVGRARTVHIAPSRHQHPHRLGVPVLHRHRAGALPLGVGLVQELRVACCQRGPRQKRDAGRVSVLRRDPQRCGGAARGAGTHAVNLGAARKQELEEVRPALLRRHEHGKRAHVVVWGVGPRAAVEQQLRDGGDGVGWGLAHRERHERGHVRPRISHIHQLARAKHAPLRQRQEAVAHRIRAPEHH
mmetsp:Transcript_34956/g.58893  ORF Transcript_34956/g.58893 Transcript_34956/m.58893 type:complete len:443 (+) Transcript_34956:438-1766(+)